LERISTDPDLTGYCEGLLEREARRWDGRPRDPRTGRALGRIRLGIASARQPVLAMYAQWDERLPEAMTVVSPAGSLELSRWEGWYAPYPLPVEVGDALSEGLELRGEQWRFAFQADDTYALAYDDDLGAWVSVDAEWLRPLRLTSHDEERHVRLWDTSEISPPVMTPGRPRTPSIGPRLSRRCVRLALRCRRGRGGPNGDRRSART
jgi:hypothetical protein